MCGACCVAPDIAALDKPLGLRCPHLADDSRCLVYEHRPAVCRSYAADAVCERIAAPTLEQRVQKYLALFQLEGEAAQVKASGLTSMKALRP
jgi:Fe-S-cluster containining protein